MERRDDDANWIRHFLVRMPTQPGAGIQRVTLIPVEVADVPDYWIIAPAQNLEGASSHWITIVPRAEGSDAPVVFDGLTVQAGAGIEIQTSIIPGNRAKLPGAFMGRQIALGNRSVEPAYAHVVATKGRYNDLWELYTREAAI